MEPLRRPDAPVPLNTAHWYSRDDVHRYFSSGQNFNPLPTDPDYKERFDELLAGYSSSEAADLIEDLEQLELDVPDVTERDVLAKARIGQGRFRADLVAYWRKGETCALTGLGVPEMLIASHIKPWRESSNAERLDPMNGLLLVAHADRLFDRYLMSFQESRGMFVSVLHPRIRAEVAKLGLREGMQLDTSHLGFSDEARFRRYMAEHLQRHRDLVNKDKPTD
ncbi:HNH endonuclease [Noviherbaspirillum sp. UKPF54]|nr:HNH endonuclease [Noviherbaspirillum sp. UKPF54]